jgi:hypothetical protein
MLAMAGLGKKQKFIGVVVIGFILMVATVPAAIWVTHTQTAEAGNRGTRCKSVKTRQHLVVIKDNKVTPAHTAAKLCETLVILNRDGQERLVAFGTHDNHISYDGVSERHLAQGDSLTVRLIRSGDYLFHDHLDDSVRGTFAVTP